MRRLQVSARLLSIFVLCVPAWCGNDLEKEFRHDYVGKELTLRHFYKSNHLRFRADGSLAGDAAVGPWSIDGRLSVEDVSLQGDAIEIKGRRIFIEFRQQGAQDALTTLDEYRGKERKDMEDLLRQTTVEIEIELPDRHPDSAAITAAMKAVFLAPDESMLAVAPEYWRQYFAEQAGQRYVDPERPSTVYFFRQSNGMTPPKANFDPEPEYSDVGRKLKYQGTVLLSLVIDTAGNAKNIQIVRPIGLGLDEAAVTAVSKWKFDPCTKDGVPVPVEIKVETNFHLY